MSSNFDIPPETLVSTRYRNLREGFPTDFSGTAFLVATVVICGSSWNVANQARGVVFSTISGSTKNDGTSHLKLEAHSIGQFDGQNANWQKWKHRTQ